MSILTYYQAFLQSMKMIHCQPECACLHKTVYIVVFFLKIMKIPTQKGEHSCKCTELSLKRNELIIGKGPIIDVCLSQPEVPITRWKVQHYS